MRIRDKPSFTYLATPYLTPNGVTHLTMLLIDIKIRQNHAGKNHGFCLPLPNGVTHLNIPPTDVKKNDKTNQKKIILAWALKISVHVLVLS